MKSRRNCNCSARTIALFPGFPMSFRERIQSAAGQFNEWMAEQAGIEVLHDFGEVAEELMNGVKVVVALRVRGDGELVWAEIEATTHHRRRITVARIGVLFSSVEEMRDYFAALPEDPAKAIDERCHDPQKDRPPFLDRLFSWLAAGARDYRLVADHRLGERHRFRAFAFRMRGGKRGVNLVVGNFSTGRHQEKSIAVFAATFGKCVNLLASTEIKASS